MQNCLLAPAGMLYCSRCFLRAVLWVSPAWQCTCGWTQKGRCGRYQWNAFRATWKPTLAASPANPPWRYHARARPCKLHAGNHMLLHATQRHANTLREVARRQAECLVLIVLQSSSVATNQWEIHQRATSGARQPSGKARWSNMCIIMHHPALAHT